MVFVHALALLSAAVETDRRDVLEMKRKEQDKTDVMNKLSQ